MPKRKSHSILIAIGALVLFISTLLGAYGNHSLNGSVDAQSWNAYQIAVEYQFYYGLGITIVGIVAKFYPESKLVLASGWLLFLGVVVFSGSIYLTSFTGLKGINLLAPVGGLCMMAGWLSLVAGVFKK
tara:strand:- start:1499 stop:1885 length:387 start_codon:yes stop_codon:yes gene_type:complete